MHPQNWPEDLRYDGKRVVVIGSGATAVTIVPAMAAKLRRWSCCKGRQLMSSLAPPRRRSKTAQTWLPARAAHAAVRWKNILLQLYLYRLSRRKPAGVRRRSSSLRKPRLASFNATEYFNPRYEPWDQRMCIVPDGDLFAAMRAGKASIVNGEIETFTETGLRLTSGREIEADIIVTATGLKVRLMGGVAIEVDGAPVNIASHDRVQGNDVQRRPKSRLRFRLYQRVLDAQVRSDRRVRVPVARSHGSPRLCVCTPRLGDSANADKPTLPLTSGYIERAKHLFLKQGEDKPWRINQNYALDVMAFSFAAVEDGALEFRRRVTAHDVA